MDLTQLEAFALAPDRLKALEQFIPGTEDYYFCACLAHEQLGRFADIEALLTTWTQRYGDTARCREIRHRLALLRHGEQPQATLEYLIRELGIEFNHQREVAGRAQRHPNALDPKLLSHDHIRKTGLAHSNAGDLAGFTDAALEWLVDESIDAARLRTLLSRLTRPDAVRLPELVLAELKDRHSRGFGALPIHKMMLLEQLETLARARPDLRNVEAFVHTWLTKLHPGPDSEWVTDRVQREAYLDRLWSFVRTLAPSFNALKAHVLHHRLDHDRRCGVCDQARVLEYVKLPRQVAYANPKYLERFRDAERPFPLGQDFRRATLLPTVTDDTALVRDLLSQLFRDVRGFQEFEPYIEVAFLRTVFATTKILHGIGDREQWFSMLDDPAGYAVLKDRVEIEFAPTLPNWFRAHDPVVLDVDVKNVGTLVVKVFEINALNYFLATGREVDTSVDLDGLTASEERTVTYAEPPVRRVRRRFELPALAGPGTYVVEFMGGGISSRALIRKGRLALVERLGAAGHAFRIVDEDRTPLPEATLWLAGREFRADADGEIRVPFATEPGRKPVLLRHGAMTTLEWFVHRDEAFTFAAHIHADRESLLAKREAQVLVRPSLRVHGVAVSPSLLEDVVLKIRSTDGSGVESSAEIPNFVLHEDRESVHTFQVPEHLTAIEFSVLARIAVRSTGKDVVVSDTRRYTLNGIDATAHTEGLHLARTDQGWVLHVLGKSGEARGRVPVNVELSHRDLRATLDVTLQTDEAGRIALGVLPDVTAVRATTPSGVTDGWTLPRDSVRRPAAIHAREGEAIRLPHLTTAPLTASRSSGAPERRDFALLERVGDLYFHDRFSALRVEDGFLAATGLPAGDYELWCKREDARIHIRVAPGASHGGWVLGGRRLLECGVPDALHVVGAQAGRSDVTVHLANACAATRVHVFATRWLPAHPVAQELGSAGDAGGPRAVEVPRSLSNYVSGRELGDEYRYVLERKLARKYPGSLLARPGLLLNPWAVRGTETATQTAAAGGAYAACPAPMASMAAECGMEPCEGAIEAGAFAGLDFLAQPSAVLVNLRPDADGVVRFPRATVAHANQIRIVAVREDETVVRDLLLPEVLAAHQDLRLRLALDAQGHFTSRQQVTALSPGQPLEIADLTTSKVEVYDTLARVYRLFTTLTNDTTLASFGFVLNWPTLSEAEKRAKYSEFACHELSFFVSCKDDEFFQRVIRPYLRNKKEKTFLDCYLLGDDLARYRTPWAYGRLNVVERILLARRFDEDGDPCARHVGDRNDLLPRDPAATDRLFQAAVRGRALDAGDALGIDRAREEAVRERSKMVAFGAADKEESGTRVALKRKSAMKPRPEADEEMAIEDAEEQVHGGKVGSLGDAVDDAKGAGRGGGPGARRRDLAAREQNREFYQKLDRTQEWAENQYYHRSPAEQTAELVQANPFWRDYAAHRFHGPFLSANVARAAGNFTEMMFALSVLDLPFAAEAPRVEFTGARMKLATPARAIAFHEEIKPAERATERVPVLVSQNYFRDDDRSRFEDGEEVDKYVIGEFLVEVVYACQVVLTNPTSSRQKLDLLMQIPQGAIPVKDGFVTRGMPVELEPYETESVEVAFYFPAPGDFPHFPVHVSRNERLIAHAEPAILHVVREPSRADETSWAWVSQHGSAAAVLKWMAENNLDRLTEDDADPDLAAIAWRMKERSFYEPCLALLRRRHVYDDTLWSYSLRHGDGANIREYLLHQEAFLDQCGAWLQSPLVDIDPVARGRFQHLEYAPIVHARVQRLGARLQILNNRLAEYVRGFLELLCYRGPLTDADWLAVACLLLAQDRVGEGLDALERVNPVRIETKLQHDYVNVVAELLRERPTAARAIAEPHQDHPVDRWRDLFRSALAQVSELAGTAAPGIGEPDREQRQAQLAASEPGFEFALAQHAVTVNYRNLASVTVNYYRMDIELLFSRQPFVQQQSGQFSFIRPNQSVVVKLPAGETVHRFELPTELRGANVIVELVAAGKSKSQACYAHDLGVQVTEAYGRLRVVRQSTSAPLPKTYVKVYGRTRGGEVRFYKDGYTDLRGVFDYTSLSTNEMDFVERFSLLVLSEEHGAVIREAGVPGR